MAPTAIAIPPSDMMFDVRPIIFMGMNAMITATGMVTIGMMALGMCQRKIMMTMATMINSSVSVCFKFSMDRRISSDRSYAVTTFTPGGRPPSISLSFCLTRSITCRAFSPWRMIDDAGDGLTRSVPVRNAAADVGSESHVTHVRDEDRDAVLGFLPIRSCRCPRSIARSRGRAPCTRRR